MTLTEPREPQPDPLERLAELVVFAHGGEDEPGNSETTADALQRQSLEETAAMAMAVFAVSRPTAAPGNLTARLAAAGLQFCASRPRATTQEPASKPLPAQQTAGTPPPGKPTTGGTQLRPQPLPVAAAGRRSGNPLLAVLLGVAAALLLWALLPPRLATAVSPTGEPQRDGPQQIAALLAKEQTAIRHHWQPGSSPLRGEVHGEVVWSDQLQRGVMSFRGLPPLDEDHRFQLWIVDGTREGPPVDGGLFAVDDAARETLVAVLPKLPVGKAAAFVVTVEDKAGAVVSSQEHVVAIAGL